MACEASEQSCPLLSSDAAVDKAVFNRDPQAPESSVQQVVAPAVDKRAESPSACFLSLEQHQQKCAGCETLTKEVEKLAALVRTLTEENRLFRETLETLLKKKNVSIRELHPGTEGETPKLPVAFSDIAVHFSEQEWGILEEWQKELYRAVMRSNYEMLVSLDAAVSEPNSPSQMEAKELCTKDPGDVQESEVAPVDPTASQDAVTDAPLWIKEELEEEEVWLTSQQNSGGAHLIQDMSLDQVAQPDGGPQLKEEEEEEEIIRVKVELLPGSPCSEPLLSAPVKQEEEDMCTEEQPDVISVPLDIAEYTVPLQTEEGEGDWKPRLSKTFRGKTVLQSIPVESKKKTSYGGRDRFHCSMCNKNFVHQVALAKHMVVHSCKQQFHCAQCNRSFAFQKQLSQHLRTHVPKMEFCCAVCKLPFPSQQSLHIHQRVHVDKSSLYCAMCDKTFAYTEAFEKHQELHVTCQFPQCSECNIYFTDEAALEQHKQIHAKDWPFRCVPCNRTFVHQALLMEHLQKHGRTRIYQCHVCGSSFSYKEALESHLVEHDGAPLLQCGQCNSSFAHPSLLAKHQGTHGGAQFLL